MRLLAKFLSDLVPVQAQSSLDFLHYPSLRDHWLHSADGWLAGKRLDDNAENLWRIHGNLYDFSDFVRIHPGGADWLTLTKGTDISEAFECHHITQLPEQVLCHYFVRKASGPANTPFSFKEDGFYRTLKRRVRDHLRNVPKTSDVANYSQIYTDSLFLGFVTLAMLASYANSNVLAAMSGLCLGLVTVAAHNYFHQKDNFRMYYFDFSMMSSRCWRITHALSHHIYTNTIYDYEIAFAEPFMQYLPIEKHFIYRYASWLAQPVVFLFMFPASYARIIAQMWLDNGASFHKAILLPFITPTLMWLLPCGGHIIDVVRLFIIIIVVGGFYFALIGVNAAHHHPDIFHDGDTPRSKSDLDWGLHQMAAVMDRKDINRSDFLILTTFGDHCMHHLFPTLDHGRLKHFHKIFVETCREFDVVHKIGTQMDLVIGQYKQLARIQAK